MSLNACAEQLLLAVKTEQPTERCLQQLRKASLADLKALESDEQKITFWVNCYNAWYQIMRTQHAIAKGKIYTCRQFHVAGHVFSLDDIEHGILRRFRFKYLAGYLPNPFVRSIISDLAVSEVDWRIHFALNCGAVSCPPIAYYCVEKIDEQLELATRSFLTTETKVDRQKKELHVTRIFLWFAADFGGKSGVRQLLGKYLQIETRGFRLIYKPYHWDDHLRNFANT